MGAFRTEAELALAPRAAGAGGLGGKVSLLFAAVYLHYGVFGVFAPVWLTHQGLRADRVGLLVSTPLLLRLLFVAPITGLADRLRRIRELLFLCLAATALFMAALGFVHGFVALAVFFTILSVAWDPIPILADSYAVAAVRARGLDFGRMRVWGSLAFILANLAGGKIIDLAGITIMPMLTAALLLAPLIVIPFLPPDRQFGDPAPPSKGEWRTLLHDRPLVVVVVATALLASSQGLQMTFAAIHWTAKGYSAAFIGVLSAVGIASEIVVLWCAQRLLGGRSPLWLIAASGVLTLLRWLLMALDPGPILLIPVQVLQGSGMGMIAGLMLFIARRVPVHLIATAQGLNAVVLGALGAACAMTSGFLWQAFGARGYLLMALIAASGLLLVGSQIARPGRSDQIA